MKTPVLGSLFNKAAGLPICNFFKETPTELFPLDIVKFLGTEFFIENLRWLLLTVLLPQSKVNWGVCSSISRLRVISNLIKNLNKTLHNFFDKTIFLLSELINHVLSISEYVLEKQLLSSLMKNLHKAFHNNDVTSRVRRLSSPTLCD